MAGLLDAAGISRAPDLFRLWLGLLDPAQEFLRSSGFGLFSVSDLKVSHISRHGRPAASMTCCGDYCCIESGPHYANYSRSAARALI